MSVPAKRRCAPSSRSIQAPTPPRRPRAACARWRWKTADPGRRAVAGRRPMNTAADTPTDPAAAAAGDRLRLTEIFLSLQGEARAVGWPTVFVRLTGCPLRCQYCDTAYAFHGGEWRDIEAILDEVAGHGARHVCVTGGEPLAQRRCITLLQRLCDAGYDVSLETSGAI